MKASTFTFINMFTYMISTCTYELMLITQCKHSNVLLSGVKICIAVVCVQLVWTHSCTTHPCMLAPLQWCACSWCGHTVVLHTLACSLHCTQCTHTRVQRLAHTCVHTCSSRAVLDQLTRMFHCWPSPQWKRRALAGSVCARIVEATALNTLWDSAPVF